VLDGIFLIIVIQANRMPNRVKLKIQAARFPATKAVFYRLHDVIYQNIPVFIFTALGNSDLVKK
jgi:hypothetical protein